MSETVYGVEMPEGEDVSGFIGSDAIAIVKMMNPDGSQNILFRFSPNLQPWDVMGLLDAASIAVQGQYEQIITRSKGE